MDKATKAPWTPRSGKDEISGYVWLPRMLDKARHLMQGPSDGYLALEDSYMDRLLLQHWKLKGDQIRGWVKEGLDDAAIAARIAAHAGEDEPARSAWSESFRQKYGIVLGLIDATEERVPAGVGGEVLRVVGRASNQIYDKVTEARPWQLALGVAGILVGGVVAVLVTSALRDQSGPK